MIPGFMSLRAALTFRAFDHQRIVYWWDRLFPMGMVLLFIGFAVHGGLPSPLNIIDLLLVLGFLVALSVFNSLFMRRSLRNLSNTYALREEKLAEQERRRS